MFRYPWLNNLLGLSPSRNNLCRQTSRQRNSVRLLLESLEDRIVPADAVATATTAVTIPYSPNAQTYALKATVTDIPNPGTTVKEGTVTFTVVEASDQIVVGTGSGVVGANPNNPANVASASVQLRKGLPPGAYLIETQYDDGAAGKFKAGTNGTNTLTVRAASVMAAAANETIFYRTNNINLEGLSAKVSDLSIPSDNVNQGTVTFTIRGGARPITVTGTFNDTTGTFTGSFNPGGMTVGNYPITVSYTDSLGDFVVLPGTVNTPGTLFINPAQVIATASPASMVFYSKMSTGRPPGGKGGSIQVSAVVTDDSFSMDTVNEGSVTFKILGNSATGPVKVDPKTGVASASAIVFLPYRQPVGSYDIEAVYSDPKPGNFANFQSFGSTLTITPAKVGLSLATDPSGSAPAGKPVSATTTVTDQDHAGPGFDVFEGKVTLTVMQGKNTIDTYTSNVTDAQTQYFVKDLKLKPGDYTLVANYTDPAGNYSNATTSGELTITKGNAKAMANPVQDMFSANAQTVVLSATVKDADDPSIIINQGMLTFNVAGIGIVQAPVVNGKATADITIPADEPTGTYAISVSFSDLSRDFEDDGDKGSDLTISNCNCATIASTSANQMTQNLFTYIGNLEAQLSQSAQTFFTSLSAVLSGQQPLSTLVQPLLQLYQAIVVFQEVAHEPFVDPLAFGATGGGETFPAPLPSSSGE